MAKTGRTDTRTGRQAAARLAWPLWAFVISLVAGSLVLCLASRAPLYEATSAIIAPTFATLGALISSRRSGNVMGWIFLAAGILEGVLMFSGQYATVALAPNSLALPGGSLAAWFANLVQNSFVGCILFLVWLFPDGRLPSRRWRTLAWVIGIFLAVSLVIAALRPGPFAEFPSISNPFGIKGATLPEPVMAAGEFILLACMVAVSLSLILRFYRSRSEERLQMKWFTYAATVVLPTPLLLSVLAPAAYEVLGPFVWTLAFLSLPVSAAVAILKYRLYDIDLLINRTLVYGALTVSLVLVYLGGVVGLQYVFRTLTGGESQLAVVASTLVIAALFNPLRGRIQRFIDRIFYRRKYDAAKTLEKFGSRLRDEMDLNDLSDGLTSVVRETLQPAHVSLWLRSPEDEK